jgi:uncharacterized protein YkwD
MNNLKNKIISSLILVLIFILILSLLVCFNVNYKNTNNRIEILGADINNNQPCSSDDKIQNTQISLAQNVEVNLSDYENTVVYLINTTRVNNGLNALTPNQMLTDIARSRSSDMIARNYFAHYTPGGKNIFNVLKENGVNYTIVGENLAQSMPTDIGTPEAFMNAWMNSPSHAANILRNGYGTIGVGVSDNGGDRRVLTTVFKNF